MGLFRRPRNDPAELAQIKEQLRFMREHWDAAAQRRDEDAQRLATVEAANTDLASVTERLARLDDRITSVSTELANQVNELGNEIERLGGNAPDEVRLDEIRTGQERLANEQARYQIAFREDLARLAEQLRRASPPR
ncbi:MAG: hypothetical protein WKF58_18420 [Ilumatobacteraceae bacterium]|jgi:chromosome segregation ATPase